MSFFGNIKVIHWKDQILINSYPKCGERRLIIYPWGDMRNQQAKIFPGESTDIIGVVAGSQS